MLAKWTKILPVFFVQWLANSRCPQVNFTGTEGLWLHVYDDMIIRERSDMDAIREKWRQQRIQQELYAAEERLRKAKRSAGIQDDDVYGW